MKKAEKVTVDRWREARWFAYGTSELEQIAELERMYVAGGDDELSRLSKDRT